MKTIKKERLGLLPLKLPKRKMPKTVIAKHSIGPNNNATLDRATAKNISPTRPKVPAIQDPMAEAANAAPALPFLAISCPSKHVTTLAASPGRFNKIDVVDPPYMAP